MELRDMRKNNLLFLGFGLVYVLAACSGNNANKEAIDQRPTLVEVEAAYNAESNEHSFITETDTIPAGWTTIRLKNGSPFVHFAFFDKVPGGRNSTNMHAEVLPVFQEAAYLVEEGKGDEALAAFGKMPPWFGEIVFMGGTGYLSPGLSTETTLFLPPGNYMMECYIKNEDGTYHWNMGMYVDLHVTQDTTNAQPPQDVDVTITTTDSGLKFQGEPKAGENLIAVYFNEENPGLLRRDVHVIEVNDETSEDEVLQWIDFNQTGSLISTMEDPGPATFVGGTHDMPKGYTTYFKVDLDPNKEYAWVTEQAGDRFEYIPFEVSE